MTSVFRLSLDWGDFVYFFWAYLWKSIEFLRVDRMFNEQGAFQVPCFLGILLLCICLQFLLFFSSIAYTSPLQLSPETHHRTSDFSFSCTCSTTRLPHGAIIRRSLTALLVKKYMSLAFLSAALVRYICKLEADLSH
jgi:hypothetical protein